MHVCVCMYVFTYRYVYVACTILRVQGHTAEIVSLNFNQHGDQIITGSFDHTVKVCMYACVRACMYVYVYIYVCTYVCDGFVCL